MARLTLDQVREEGPSTDLRALASECRHCGASAGVQCWTVTGRAAPLHRERRDLNTFMTEDTSRSHP